MTVSIAVSILSTLAYLGVFGYVAIFHNSSSRLNKQMARGMSLVLVFVLVQSGLTLGALFQEKREYQKTVDALVEADGWTYGDDAKVYGGGWILMSTIVLAFLLSLLLLLEFLFGISQSGSEEASSVRSSTKDARSSSMYGGNDNSVSIPEFEKSSTGTASGSPQTASSSSVYGTPDWAA